MEKRLGGVPQAVNRQFEADEGMLTSYVDISMIADLGNEFVMQFFQTEIGVPGPDGNITQARAVLKSKLVISLDHAKKLKDSLEAAILIREKK